MIVTCCQQEPIGGQESRADPVLQADMEYAEAAYRHDVVARRRKGISTTSLLKNLMRARQKLRLACSVHSTDTTGEPECSQ